MLHTEQWMDIHLFQKQGLSIRAIAARTGHSRNTVRKMLRAKEPPAFKTPARANTLDAFAEYVTRRYHECGLSGVRLLEELRPMGFTGSIHMVRRLLARLRLQRLALAKATVRFETPAGEQAQADWAHCGRFSLPPTDPMLPTTAMTPEGAAGPARTTLDIYAFVMVLSFSRALFVHFTTSMRLAELIRCHQGAFGYLGGVPKAVLYDNMKQVRLSRQEWNEPFVDFAAHYGFVPRTCRVRRPRTKGKVERMVDYVKDNFLNGRSFTGLEDLNVQGQHWLDHVANLRIHATTGKRPIDLLAEERPHLTPLSLVRPYRLVEPLLRKVGSESLVRINGSRYSVPPAYVGRQVAVLHDGQRIVVRCGDLVIAEHAPAPRPGSCITQKEHVEELWKQTLKRPAPPVPSWTLSFDQPVAATPLERYEAACAMAGAVGVGVYQ